MLGSLPPHEVEPAQIRNPTHTPHFAFFPQGPPVSKRLSSKVLLHTLLHAALGPADLESGIWHLRVLTATLSYACLSAYMPDGEYLARRVCDRRTEVPARFPLIIFFASFLFLPRFCTGHTTPHVCVCVWAGGGTACACTDYAVNLGSKVCLS